jgi:hypothetical protein
MASGLVRDGIITKEYAHKLLEFEDLIESTKLEEALNQTINKLAKKLNLTLPPEGQFQNMDQAQMMEIDGQDPNNPNPMGGAINRNFNNQVTRGEQPVVKTDQTSTP